MSEILFKVGASGGYRDGDVIEVMPDGWLIPAADMATWLKDGKEPAVLAQMPQYVANQVRRRILGIVWRQSHTEAEVEAEYKLPARAGEMEKADADRDALEFSTNGLDTNWGTLSLKHHAVVRVTNLTAHEAQELLDGDWVNDHTNKTLGKVRYRLPYNTLLSPAIVADMQDREKRVDVDRVSPPFVKTVVQKAPWKVEKI